MLWRISTVSCWYLARAEAARIRTRRLGSRTASSRIGIVRGCGISLSAIVARRRTNQTSSRARSASAGIASNSGATAKRPCRGGPDFRARVGRKNQHFVGHVRSRKFAGHASKQIARFSIGPPEKGHQRRRTIHEAAHERVGNGVGRHFQAADHEAFDDGFRSFGKKCPAQALNRGHTSVQLPVVKLFGKRGDRFGHAHRAERQHGPSARPPASGMHFLNATIQQARSREGIPAGLRGPYPSPR